MQYFAWGINKPGVKEKRTALIRAHWDFIAQYNDDLIARGPVMDANNHSEVIGSIHIVDLPDAGAVETFVHDEPFADAGLFREIIVKRFRLELNRTQFSFQSTGDYPRFFIYCTASIDKIAPDDALTRAHQAYMLEFDQHVICHGALLGRRGDWQGKVFFVEFSDERKAREFLESEPLNLGGLYNNTKFHRWTMGGPENLNSIGALD